MRKLLKSLRKWTPLNWLVRRLLKGLYRFSAKGLQHWPVYGAVHTQVQGVPLRMDIAGESASSNLLYYGAEDAHEQYCLDFYMRVARHPMVKTVADVGAHSGLYGLLAAKARPDVQAYMFEPFENNARVVRRNIALNKLPNAHLVQEVVGPQVGEVQFNVSADDDMLLVGSVNDWWTTYFYKDSGRQYKQVTLPQTSLDAFAQKHNLKSLDLVKIDVESYEKEVIDGMSHLLATSSPIFLCEVMPFTPTRQDLEDLLTAQGYTFWTLGRGGMQRVNNMCGNVNEINYALLRTGDAPLGVRHPQIHVWYDSPEFVALLHKALQPPFLNAKQTEAN
jgi:FkbM family methyltransferase